MKQQESFRETPNKRCKIVLRHIVRNISAWNFVSNTIEGRTYRALIDTGADQLVIRIYESFRSRFELQRKYVSLRSANGYSLNLVGFSRLQVRIGNQSIPHIPQS